MGRHAFLPTPPPESEGEPCDPEICGGCWYGMAPHVGMLPGVGHVNAPIDRRLWPPNFEEDRDEPGMGTYHCPRCCECDRDNGDRSA